MSSNAIHENKKRRATQIVTGSFSCRKWLHKLYSHISPFCELCRKEKEASGQPTDNLPLETVAHIQSAGCKEQKQCVTQAHNSCWKFLLRSIMEHGEAERDFLFLGEDKVKQLTTLWRDAEVEDLFPWAEVEEAARNIMSDEQEDDDRGPEEGQDDSYADVVVGKRRPDAVVLDRKGKNIFVLEFKRTSDQRRDYREKGAARAAKQHNVVQAAAAASVVTRTCHGPGRPGERETRTRRGRERDLLGNNVHDGGVQGGPVTLAGRAGSSGNLKLSQWPGQGGPGPVLRV